MRYAFGFINIRCLSLTLAYIEPRDYELPEPLQIELNFAYRALVCTFRLESKEFFGAVRTDIDDKPCLFCVVRALTPDGHSATSVMGATCVEELNFAHPLRVFFRLAFYAALFMVQVPKDGVAVQDKFVSGRKVKGNGSILPELWQARFVGESFNIPPMPAPMLSSRKDGEPS